MKKRIVALFLMFMLLFSGIPASFAASDGDAGDTFFTIQENANTQRKAIIQTGQSVAAKAYMGQRLDSLLSAQEIQALASQRYGKKDTLTVEEALQDVDTLFRTYKSAYGLYYYFGESAFSDAEATIIKELNKKQSIHTNDLEKLIGRNLLFMRDAHSRVGGYLPTVEGGYVKKYHYASNIYLQKDETGYFRIKSGEQWYLTAVNGNSQIAPYVKPCIQADGSITYGLGQLFKDAAQAKSIKTITFSTANGKSKTEKIKWTLGENYAKSSIHTPDYSYSTKSGVPIVTIRSMKGDARQLNDFVNSGKTLRGKKTVIIDIRSNGGGNNAYPDNWFKNFTGALPQLRMTHIRNESALAQALGNGSAKGWISNSKAGRFVPNKTNIIVLIDSNAGSAGESMIMNLRTLENVVFIGSNSAGFLIGANQLDLSLPISGMPVTITQGIHFIEGGENRDGIGFEPDIWVNPKDALTLALKMVEYYNLA
ncbi:MAG TPA: S41 family peptidase [Anaerovoracaceae bacterium]|nr:S41 family peptidase [Anaerovoracaceae bacterium]